MYDKEKVRKNRQNNLRRLVEENGRAEIARQLKSEPSYISQLVHGHGSFGDAVSRRIEKSLHLKVGWLDNDGEAQRRELPVITYAEAALTKRERMSIEPREVVYFMVENASESAFAVRVTDTLMLGDDGGIAPGAIVAIEPDVKPTNGCYVLALPDNEEEPVLRQLVRDGQQWTLAPKDTRHLAKPMSSTDQVIGVATNMQQSLY